MKENLIYVAVQVLILLLERWLGKTSKTEAGSILELAGNALKGKKL